MFKVVGYTFLFCIFSSISIVLTGSRSLISGNIFDNFFKIILDLRFISAFVLSVAARFIFILINNALLSIPDLAKTSTTITVLITSIGYFVTILLNAIFLGESLTIKQGGGALLIVFGIVLLMS